MFGDALLDFASADRNTFGVANADLDSGEDIGTVKTTLEASDSVLQISSLMGVSSEFHGSSEGSGQYEFAESTLVSVDWSWLDISLAGGWKILDASGMTVASLTFSGGTFDTIGGDFAQSFAGNASVTLGAGEYRFVASYDADTMPTSSLVTFSFGAVPAPGAFTLLAAAGLVGASRRRR